jgi:hypothetical protein
MTKNNFYEAEKFIITTNLRRELPVQHGTELAGGGGQDLFVLYLIGMI